jgi:hypothetical protein
MNTLEKKEMNKEFRVHMLTEEGKNKASQIAVAFNECLERLIEIRGGEENPSRYLSIVRTKLEEACFFAKKSVASNYKELN